MKPVSTVGVRPPEMPVEDAERWYRSVAVMEHRSPFVLPFSEADGYVVDAEGDRVVVVGTEIKVPNGG